MGDFPLFWKWSYMIVSFCHAGLSRLYKCGQVTAIQMAEDRRCLAVMDVLASLHPDESIPVWLEPACLIGIPTASCIPITDHLYIAFNRQGPDVTEVRLASSLFEAPRTNIASPAMLGRQPTHPGAVFRDLFMVAMNLSPAAACRLLSMPTGSLFRFFAGGRRAVGNFAQELARVSGTTASFWTRIQSVHDHCWPLSADAGLSIVDIERALDTEVSLRRRKARLDRGFIGKLRRRLRSMRSEDSFTGH